MTCERSIRVTLTNDGREACVSIPKGLSPGVVTPANLVALVRQAGVQITPSVETATLNLADLYGAGTTDVKDIVARATPPQRGVDGRIEWELGFDPNAVGSAARSEAVGVTSSVDHYKGQEHTRVKCGQTIGRVVPPTAGIDGKNVRGEVLSAVPGKPAKLELDASLRLGCEGDIIAVTDGLLSMNGARLALSNVLTIPNEVDFSVGHIDFDGDVQIARGVRTGFKVNAGGSITIDGLVEATHIECRGDLTLRTGMAGKGSGSIKSAGNAEIGYLEGVNGSIEGNLVAHREVADSRLIVGGSLNSPGCTVFGGELSVAGSCVLSVLGSPSFTPTLVRLGDLPLSHVLKRDIERAIKRIDSDLKQLAEQERCIRLNPRPRPSERERLTELAFEVSELDNLRRSKAIELGTIEQTLDARPKIDVRIGRAVYPHVRLWIRNHRILFDELVKGPLSIFWDVQGMLLCQIGTADPRPLSSIAKVTTEKLDTAKAKAA